MSFQLQSVLITDEIDSQCVEILQKNGIQVVKNTKLTKEQLIAEIPVSIYSNTSTPQWYLHSNINLEGFTPSH